MEGPEAGRLCKKAIMTLCLSRVKMVFITKQIQFIVIFYSSMLVMVTITPGCNSLLIHACLKSNAVLLTPSCDLL